MRGVGASLRIVVDGLVRERRFWGKYRGVVTDDSDPLAKGRLRARVPAVLGDEPSGWALPCVPYLGSGEGPALAPPVGSGVWIEFEEGDLSRPIWVGCMRADGSHPGR